MADLITPALLAASAFFVVLAFVLLYRYRQVSTQINASNDLGRDLWQALEARLKKQDERILDMMGRVEVIQSRALQGLSHPTAPEPMAKPEPVTESKPEAPKKGKAPAEKSPQARETPKSEPDEPKSEERLQPEPSQVTSQTNVSSVEPALAKEIEFRLLKQDEALTGITAVLTSIQSQLKEAPPRVSAPVPTTVRQAADAQPRERTKVDKEVLMEMLAEGPKTSTEVRQRFNISREHAIRILKDLHAKGLAAENAEHKPFVYELTEAGKKQMGDSQS